MEFLVSNSIKLPHDMDPTLREQLIAAEGKRGLELASQGSIKRIWRVPGAYASWALWAADDATHLHELLSSLPLWPYMEMLVYPLARHFADPEQAE